MKMYDYMFIDASYMLFYKLYAVLAWSKFSDTELDNDLLVSKFEKSFLKEIDVLKKKYCDKDTKIIFGLDDSLKNLWRIKHFAEYKGTRIKKDEDYKRLLFGYAYDNIFTKLNTIKVLGAEADDVIAICRMSLSNSEKCVIITNDDDYLQLCDENTLIVNLKGKVLCERYSAEEMRAMPLLKIISGDKSDNIPAIGKKIGPKTARKLAFDIELLNKTLCGNDDVKKQYDTNCILIDFKCIPEDICVQVKAQLQKLI